MEVLIIRNVEVGADFNVFFEDLLEDLFLEMFCFSLHNYKYHLEY